MERRGVRSNADAVRLAKSHTSSPATIKSRVIAIVGPLFDKYKLSYRWKGETSLEFGGAAEAAEGSLSISPTMVGVQYSLNKYGIFGSIIQNKVDSTLTEIVNTTSTKPERPIEQKTSGRGGAVLAGLVIAGLLARK